MTPSAIAEYNRRMGRWEPDGRARLQLAALELFAERGYAEVTVDEIARRAGLTKRTFFNHFTDKREVLFAGAQDFEDSVVGFLKEAPKNLEPIDAALHALDCAGSELAGYGEYARARADLIASSIELRERDLIKMAAMTAAIAAALTERGLTERAAAFTAQVAVTVFNAAYAEWIEQDATDRLLPLMQRLLDEVRQAISHPFPSRT